MPQFCARYAGEGADPDSAEVAFCQLWRAEELTDEEASEFCFLDFEARSEVLDVKTLCPCLTSGQSLLDVLDAEALCSTDFDVADATDFTTALQEWRVDAADPSCGSGFAEINSMYVGECIDGTRFLFRGDGLHTIVKFYDGDSGAFEGETFMGDFLAPPCCAIYYAPHRVECAGATVSDVLCGDWVAVGDTVEFP